ncbi:MAG: hypothetical protein M3004_07740 [Bacteroidota bacterium]|nr:hypothetical protein [Bacteroidota bacterium]
MDISLKYMSNKTCKQKDYYPGGMLMPGRQFIQSSSKYRYGFNGKENDNEVVQYDYGFRIYDPRLVRFKSVDPLQKRFAELTPFQFASNSTIASVDLDGRESQYYNTTITFINYHQCTSNGDLITGSKQEINHDIPLKTGLFPNGALGSGSMYSIQTQVVDVYKAANGDIEEVKRSQPIITKQFYKLSEEDEMKRDVNKRPMFQGKYQLMVFGSGSDNSESPGERPNPNAITESINMKAWDDIMEPILTGLGKSPIDYEPPSLEDVVKSHTDGLIRKAENAQTKKEEAERGSPYNPPTSVCPDCMSGDKHDGKTWKVYRNNPDGTPLDTLVPNNQTGKPDTLKAQKK